MNMTVAGILSQTNAMSLWIMAYNCYLAVKQEEPWNTEAMETYTDEMELCMEAMSRDDQGVASVHCTATKHTDLQVRNIERTRKHMMLAAFEGWSCPKGHPKSKGRYCPVCRTRIEPK